MYYIMYNPMSNAGRTAKDILKFDKKLRRKKIETVLVNLFELEHILEIKAALKEEDIIIIAGGDGTLHKIVNNSLFLDIKNRIFMYRSGRGNDFSRGHKGKFFEITKEIKNLPILTVGDEKSYFLNGIGLGIDAVTCQVQMQNFYNLKKESYFKIAVNEFKRFKPYKLDFTVDGKEYHYDNVWFFVVQNGKYFGGGMKISPQSVRDDEYLEMVIVHDCKLSQLLPIFPLIFIGKHTIAKKYVTFIKGKDFKITPFGCDVLQKDGEIVENVSSLEVNRFKK